MDDGIAISPPSLHATIGRADAPLIIDVRRQPAFAASDRMIDGAIRRLPDDVAAWAGALPPGRVIVVYCVHGHEVSQGVAAALRAAGRQAAFLAGGITAWVDGGLPTRPHEDGAKGENDGPVRP